MLQIGLASLLHDRSKFFAALAGVSLAVTLVLGQSGLYAGFVRSSSAIIRHVGGDVWVMARGVHVLENSELMSPGTRELVASHPCVVGVRPLLMSWTAVRQASGALETAIVIGYDSQGERQLPWAYARGLPFDLVPPFRVAVDSTELEKLELPREGIEGRLEINNKTVYVAAVTQGIRAFTLTPYVFTTFDSAHQLLDLPWKAPSYWVLDLKNPSCAADVIHHIEQAPHIQARTTAEFSAMTESFWVGGSGAGNAIGLSALMALLVGGSIFGQTLYSITKAHEKELATLRAIGTSRLELCAFVLWQALFLAGLALVIGTVMAHIMRLATSKLGLQIALTGPVFVVALLATGVMVTLGSLLSLRRLLTLTAGEIFR